MSSTDLRVTVVQAAPRPRSISENIANVRATIESSDADLVVYPELFLPGYETENLDGLAITIRDARLRPLAASCRARGTALLIGFIESSSEGYYDSFLAIDRDGEVLPAIRKSHLFGGERDVFRSGDTIAPIRLCGVQVGVMNCFEVEFPEVARTLALLGAKLFVVGSANMHPYEPDHRIATFARALENRVPLAYANRVGRESGHDFCGASRLIDAGGIILGGLDTHETGTLTAILRTGAPPTPDTDMLAQRRPELYQR